MKALLSEAWLIYTREHPLFAQEESSFRWALFRSSPYPSALPDGSTQFGKRSQEMSRAAHAQPPLAVLLLYAVPPPLALLLVVVGIRLSDVGWTAGAALLGGMLSGLAATAGAFFAQRRSYERTISAIETERVARLAAALFSRRHSQVEARVIGPEAFTDAQEIADAFKAGFPVRIDLSATNYDLHRRLIDFASGLCYSLGGALTRIDASNYLLTPAHVELETEPWFEGDEDVDETPGVLLQLPSPEPADRAWEHAQAE